MDDTNTPFTTTVNSQCTDKVGHPPSPTTHTYSNTNAIVVGRT